jgi:hypothetical protein
VSGIKGHSVVMKGHCVMEKPMIAVYVRPDIKARVPELIAYFKKNSGKESISGLLEWMLDNIIKQMDEEKKILPFQKLVS